MASFIQRVTPKAKSKLIDWPGAFEGESAPKVRVSVLGGDKQEEAYLHAFEHFAGKEGIDYKNPAFVVRERIATVFLAYEAQNDQGDWEQLAEGIDELSKLAPATLDALYWEWRAHQAEHGARQWSKEQYGQLLDLLKKNSRLELLDGLPLNTLKTFTLTLVAQLATSTTDTSPGGGP